MGRNIPGGDRDEHEPIHIAVPVKGESNIPVDPIVRQRRYKSRL